MRLKQLITEVSRIGKENAKKNLEDKPIRIMVGIGRAALVDKLGFNLVDYFQDPEYCLTYQLEQKIFLYENFDNADNHVDAWVGVDFYGAFEPSLFDQDIVWNSKVDPAYGEPIIKEEKDLDKVKYPDFLTSGLMPRAHKFYSRFKSLTDGKLHVTFPGWSHGPWGTAWMLRGFAQLCYDLMDRPQFVHRLMEFVTNARIKWEKDKAQFFGEAYNEAVPYGWKCVYADYRPSYRSDLDNDEIDGNLISPQIYKEFILPYEKKLANFYGGVHYYHSCGNLTPLLDYIRELPSLEVLHISPWTDLKIAREKIDPQIQLQKSMHPEDDVLLCDNRQMEEKLKKVLEDGAGAKMDICADGLHSPSTDFGKIKSWIAIAQKLCKGQQYL